MSQYKETEAVIHQWVREIRDLPIIISRSPLLNDYREEIEAIKKA